ncbi:MAG: CAP domain-containing protein [Methylococcaceae bacterium]
MKQLLVFLIYSLLTFSSSTYAGFNFCQENSGNTGGRDTFQQQIPLNGVVEIGELPIGVSGVEIYLTSPVDIDIQLFDKETGQKLIHWPNGILSGAENQSFVYHDTLIEWSGFNGDGSGQGNEYIKITGNLDSSTPTSRAFIMKAFGYKAGLADVNYSWNGASCEDSGSGNGSFQQQIIQNAVVEIGSIPTGVNNLNIQLESPKDVDIQLYDADNGMAIIAWPNGLLNSSTTESINYEGMEIEWSGYRGDGTNFGHEYIKISGETTRNLTMKAFGYASGLAIVNYSWGGNNDDGTPTSEEETIKNQLLSLINEARSQERNCGSTFYPATTPVTWNSKLYQAALGHSEDMAKNDYFSHTGLNGSNAGSRITAAGYSWSTYGENIAAGYSIAQSVMDGWLASSGHCSNIMKSSVTNVAVARASGGSYGIYWTQVFAKPQ